MTTRSSAGARPYQRQVSLCGLRTAASALFAWLLVACSGLAQAQVQPVARPPFPQINLPEQARSQRALQLLGTRLPELAAWYGMTAAELARQFRTDRTLWIDRRGRLLHIEEFPVPAGSTTSSTTATVAAAPYPAGDTFKLHSRPGAKRIIYLDFNGHTAAGTAWNSSYGIAEIVSPAYDLDGDPGTFSTTELERIQYIWQRVSEDFAPFDVDVTTEEPPADRLVRSATDDEYYGVRAVITKDFTASTTKPCGCGGFAYVGIFDNVNASNYQPAYVFYDKLGSGNEKYVAEAISHEVGHTAGLSHDGTSSASYYGGHGSGATSWAPIMGVGYSRSVVQWSKGEYPDANNTQDDFVVMQANGLPLKPDDHGNSPASASSLPAFIQDGVASFFGSGLIHNSADVDVFGFYSEAGTISLSITGGQRDTNVDIQAELRDAAGTLLATSNPIDALTASLSVNVVSAGQYFLTVYGVGKGDLSTGYSDYGSVGEYRIVGTAPAVGGVPIAFATATPVSGGGPLTVTFSGAQSSDVGGAIVTYHWNFGDGTTGSGASVSHTYQSAGSYNAVLTVTDNDNLQATHSVTINVTPTVSSAVVRVSAISIKLRTFRNGLAEATASVTVTSTSGAAIPNATVTGSWSGVVNGSGSALSSSSGVATFKSSRTSSTGSFAFTVTNITATGYSYDPSKNQETTDLVSR